MKEYREVKVEIGLKRKVESVVEEIERVTRKMSRSGWQYMDNHTDGLLKHVTLLFEREVA